MLLVLKIKLAVKASLVALSVGAAVAQTVPHPGHANDIPETVPVASAPFAYRLAGDFQEAGRPTDGPRDMHRLPGFRIMKYQVTTTQYDLCVADRACAPRTTIQDADPSLPAVLLSWEDARAYATWLSLRTGDLWRLPTDAEWVAAAGSRSSDDALRLPRDADVSERWLAKYDIESATRGEEHPKPVGSFGSNESGLFDLSGNVWEWTDTCFTRYTLTPAGLRATTTNCGVRVVEGAHRTYMTNFIRDARAGGCAVGKPPANLGVRLVREPRPLRRVAATLMPGGVTWR
jgi:formylglycine-generating enzyme required for sulfatase activity